MSGILMSSAVGPGFRVVVSGESITGSTGGGGDAFVSFEADGTVDKNEDGVVTQIDTETDWVRPLTFASIGDFEIRFTQNSGDAPTTGTLDTWQALGSVDRTIGYTSEGTAKLGEFLAEIRDTTDTVVDSGVYTCEVVGV